MKCVYLTLDINLQYAVKEELSKIITKYKAESGLAVIFDIEEESIISSVSLPDFNLPSFGGLDFSSLGDGGFLSGVANAVGNVIGNIGQGIGNFLGKIKISPFKGKLSGMASGFVSNLKSLNPIESLRLPGLKLQNPFDVNML